jgi:hypothetical protein
MFEDPVPWNLEKTMKMNEACPVCKQPLDLEVGFYYGSGYVSYAITVLISLLSFVAWWCTIGFNLYDNRVYSWLAANAVLLLVLQPYLMRLGRTGWLACFVRYDKNWKTTSPRLVERINREQVNNW